MRTLILTVLLLSLIPFSLYASGRSNSGGLAERVAELEAQMERVAELEAQVEILTAALQEAQEILQYVRVETGEINYLAGPHLIIEGANVHVQSGSGITSDGCELGSPDFPNCESLTGLGNLIVGYNGYNEQASSRGSRPLPREIRTGSHNLVVGDLHTYSSFGGFIAGGNNKVTSANASVSGGSNNRASGFTSSICGGLGNAASGFGSSVSGGIVNVASGTWASVSGGDHREAPDIYNWAAGSLSEPN